MKRIYELLLKSKYELMHYYCEKAFTFGETNGNWSKQFSVSKWSKKYVVDGFEGTANCIRTFKVEFDTCKEVIEYLKI
jgi:hypothetical protein